MSDLPPDISYTTPTEAANTGDFVRDPVPAYGTIDDLDSRGAELGFPLTRYPIPGREQSKLVWGEDDRARAEIITAFHDAVEKQQYDAITQFVSRGIVSPDATRHDGPTPLQVATVMGDAKLVQLLVFLGAEINGLCVVPTYFECGEANEWGRMAPTPGEPTDRPSVTRHPTYQRMGEEAPRTALMLAAARGNLAMTRLLLSLGADDAITAPDGQIALRLAATNRHRDIVNLLPERRGGALLRWKTTNVRALKAIGRALKKCGTFLYYVAYIPALIIYYPLAEGVVKPIYRGTKYVWTQPREFLGRCARAARAVPARVVKIGVDAGSAARRAPKAMGDGLVWCAEKSWTAIRALPGAVGMVAKWVWSTVTALTAALGKVPSAIVSALHTIGVAISSALSQVNLTSIGRALAAIPKAMFVDLPIALWGQVKTLGQLSYDVLKKLFGLLGQIVWFIGYGVIWLALYIPKQFVKIIGKIGQTFANGFKEVLVWFDPKHIG